MSHPARSASGSTIRTHRALALSLATAVLSLTACSSGGGDYCDVLTEDADMALAVFTPIVPDTHTVEDAQERLALLERAQPLVPAEAEEDLTSWHEDMRTAAADLDSDPDAVLELSTSEETLETGHRLVTHYGETCLG